MCIIHNLWYKNLSISEYQELNNAYPKIENLYFDFGLYLCRPKQCQSRMRPKCTVWFQNQDSGIQNHTGRTRYPPPDTGWLSPQQYCGCQGRAGHTRLEAQRGHQMKSTNSQGHRRLISEVALFLKPFYTLYFWPLNKWYLTSDVFLLLKYTTCV